MTDISIDIYLCIFQCVAFSYVSLGISNACMISCCSSLAFSWLVISDTFCCFFVKHNIMNVSMRNINVKVKQKKSNKTRWFITNLENLFKLEIKNVRFCVTQHRKQAAGVTQNPVPLSVAGWYSFNMASAVCARFLLQRSTQGFLFSSRAVPAFSRLVRFCI